MEDLQELLSKWLRFEIMASVLRILGLPFLEREATSKRQPVAG